MGPTTEQIGELAGDISGRFDPEQIILFGSHARGTARPDSDMDILVVMDYSGSTIDQALRMLQSLDRHFAIDLLVRSPEEIVRRTRLGDFFLRDVLREGRVLYDRSHTRVSGESRGRLPERAA